MWILPTLNRPSQCAEVLDRLLEMGISTPGVVVVNGEIKDYVGPFDAVKRKLPANWAVLANWALLARGVNLGAIGALNAAKESFPDEPWYGFLADDEFVLAPEFDKIMVAAAGDWDIAHGDDGFQKGGRFQGACVIGGALARAVGYLALPECWHWYGFDSMWESLAQAGACKRVYVPEVKVNHQHPYQGKGKMDSCYELGASRKDLDQQVYFNWLRHEIKNVVARVKKAKGE